MELSVVLCDDGYITQLNTEYRGKAAPTDVLSFPAADWDFLIADAPLALGDIVISLNTAEKQAAEQGYSPYLLYATEWNMCGLPCAVESIPNVLLKVAPYKCHVASSAKHVSSSQ